MNLEILNLTSRNVTVAGLSIPPARCGTVDGNEFDAWRAKHPREAVGLKVRPAAVAEAELLDNACRYVIEEREFVPEAVADIVTARGKPTVAYCETIVGRAVTGAERDRAWARVRAERAAEGR